MEGHPVLISRGAEAELFLKTKEILIKKRDSKSYRNPILDEKLRRSRTKREFKILTKLHKEGCNVPKPFKIDVKETSFEFEYINGKVLKETLTKELVLQAFKEIISLHKHEVVHLDLTTLNMLLKEKKIYIIDFGLSQFSKDIEKRGIDLFLFFNCLHNEHQNITFDENKLLELYQKEIDNGVEVIKRLEKIRIRGRNKNK